MTETPMSRIMAINVLEVHRAKWNGIALSTPESRSVSDALLAAIKLLRANEVEQIASWLEGYGDEPVDARIAAKAIRERRWAPVDATDTPPSDQRNLSK